MAGQFQGIRAEFTQARAAFGPRTPLRPLAHHAAKPLRPIRRSIRTAQPICAWGRHRPHVESVADRAEDLHVGSRFPFIIDDPADDGPQRLELYRDDCFPLAAQRPQSRPAYA